ncbi:MAG: ABC transporter ATP-binding protein [Planctomycetota bacterium]
MRRKLLWIASVWRPLTPWFLVMFAFTAFSTIVAVAYPLVFMLLIDLLRGDAGQADIYPQFVRNLVGATTGAPALNDAAGGIDPRVWTIVWLLVIVGLVRWAAGFYPAARAHVNVMIERHIRERSFARILRKGYRYFLRFRTGDLVTRLTDDIGDYPKIAWFCCSGIFRAVESASKFAFCLIIMLYLDWRLALLAISPLPVMLVVFAVAHRRLAKCVEIQRAAISETNDLLESAFSGVRIIKAFNAQERQTAALRRQLDRRIEAEMGVVKMWQVIDSLYNSLNVVGQIVVIAVGGLFVIRGDLTVGAFYAFYVYLGMLVQPLLDLPNLFVTGRQAFVCIDRQNEMRDYDTDGEGGAFRGTGTAPRFESLELKGVTFAWPPLVAVSSAPDQADQAAPGVRPDGGRPVLRDVSLRVERGQRLAVVGRLGSGKSCLLQLAAGYLIPSDGRVLLNDRPLGEYDAVSVGRLTAIVPQEPVLYSETVRENVVFGRTPDEALLRDVIAAVGMTAEIDAMPGKLDQEVGQRGITLSGGQRQRLSIARALYGRPQLLLLDDLTSALDASNEDRLWQHLQRLVPDAAMIVVTHRIATARAMDRIAILDDGRITAVGRHDELLGTSPLYAEFQHEFAGQPATAS